MSQASMLVGDECIACSAVAIMREGQSTVLQQVALVVLCRAIPNLLPTFRVV